MKTFFGIDLSITSPSICAMNEDGSIRKVLFLASKKKELLVKHEKIDVVPYPEYENDIERFYKISQILLEFIREHKTDEYKLVLEGYSYGSISSRLFQIAENGGILKLQMMLNGIDFVSIAPSAIKKTFTGKGNSNKEAMSDHFYQKNFELDLYEIFGMKRKAASPISDMIDSIAMADHARMLGT